MRKTMRRRKSIGKKKVLSLILGFVLCLSVIQEPIYTKAADGYTETGSAAVSSGNEGDEAGTSAGNEDAVAETSAGNEGTVAETSAGNEGAVAETSAKNEGDVVETPAENEGTRTETTVSGNATTQSTELLRVQGLMDALPALEELQAADMQTQQEIYEALQEAYDAYEALTEEEQALLSGADCFEALFGWFNVQVSTQDTAAENVHIHCYCGKHTVGGRCPFSSSSYGWEAIKDTDGNDKISAEELQTQIEAAQGGSYFYLTADAELASTYEVATDKNLYLCLNGHSLTGTMSDGPVLQVAGRLILTDCSEAETGKVTHEAGKTGSGISCTATGWLDMYGGSITGNTATNGGGVCCEGKFYMYGGKITQNKAESGGGVYLEKNGDVMPTIDLNGGEISSNTATNGGGIYTKDLLFFIKGTQISGNNATGNGGGICLGSSDVTLCNLMSGEISDNRAAGNGGGVYGDSPFNAQGGSITGNRADGQGGGVALSKLCYLDGSIKISGNKAGSDASLKDSNLCFLSPFTDTYCVSVQENFCGEVSLTLADGVSLTKIVNWLTGAPSGTIKMDDGTGSIDETGNVVNHAHVMKTDGTCETCGKKLAASVTPSGGSPVCYTALSSAINAAGAGETVTVLSNAALPDNYKITKGITLDLNGQKVTMGGRLFVLAMGVTIQDGNAATGSTASGGQMVDTAGTPIAVNVGDGSGNSGGLTVEGGTLGNIDVRKGSLFSLTGGKIGWLQVCYQAGTVELSGGTLSEIVNNKYDGTVVKNFLQTGYALKKAVGGTDSYISVSEQTAENLAALATDGDYYEVVPAPLTSVTADVSAAEVIYGASTSPAVTVSATWGTAYSGNAITYQWFVDGTEESGQTGNRYTFSSSHDVKTDNGTEQPYTVKCEVSCAGYTVEVEKKITVKRASFTAAVSMDGYTYETTPSTPGVSGNLGNGTVTYYYNTADSNAGGTKWENIEAGTLNAGTYYLYAVIAESTNYNAYTTATVAFQVEKAEPVVTWPTVKDVYVGDTLSNSYLDGGSADVSGSFSITGTASWNENGAKTTELTFTPTDEANYKPMTKQGVSVNVVKRTEQSGTGSGSSAGNNGYLAFAPEMIDGMNQTVTVGAGSTLTFRSNAAFADFIRVELDGETVDEGNYTKSEGSTIVTLNAEFVAGIPVGTHQLGIVSRRGTATTTFEVIVQAAVGGETETGTETGNGAWTQTVVTPVAASAATDTAAASAANAPATGDTAPLVWAIALLLCGCGVYVVSRGVGRKQGMR